MKGEGWRTVSKGNGTSAMLHTGRPTYSITRLMKYNNCFSFTCTRGMLWAVSAYRTKNKHVREEQEWISSSSSSSNRGAPTVGVVGVRTPPKLQVGVSDTPKTLKGISDLATSAVGISHFQAAVKCTKRCVESHKIAHETPQNRLPHPAPDPAGGAYDAPPRLTSPLIPLQSTPLTAVVGSL